MWHFKNMKKCGTFNMLQHSLGNFLGRDFEDAQAVEQPAKAGES